MLKPSQTVYLAGSSRLINAASISRDGSVLGTASDDGTVALWDAATGAALRRFSLDASPRTSLRFASRDPALLASGGDDERVRLFTLGRGEVAVLEGHEHDEWPATVWALAFSTDDGYVASGASDYTVRVWDPATQTAVQILRGHEAPVWDVAFCPVAPLLVSSSADHTVRVWDLVRGQPVASLTGHLDSVPAIAFSPDGSLLASGSADLSIRLWRVADWHHLATLRGHEGTIVSVMFPGRGEEIVSAGSDGSVRVWDVRSAAERCSVGGTSDSVRDLMYNERDASLALVTVHGVVHRYTLAR
jgi:WD40 repeat protein